MGIAHWDDVPPEQDLAQAAGAFGVSLRRVQLAPDDESPQLTHGTEEVIFVLAGSGTTQDSEIRAGDCIVRPVPHEDHALRAGADGLTALVFASPAQPPPFHSGASEPARILNLDDAEVDYEGDVGKWVLLARQAGAVHAGLNFGRLEPGRAGAPPHCHSEEEELFVILEDGGTLELWPPPLRDDPREQHALRAGHVVSRPPGTRISHWFRGDNAGLTFLAYGTRRPNDVCFYPRSNKIFWRGVGLIARLEPLDYDDGEPED